MRVGIFGALVLLLALAGCGAPEVRFTRTQCLPVVGDDQTEAVRFISDFQANGAMPEQQLLFQVVVVDSAGRPVQSRTGKYKDVSGNLTAAKGVMLLQSPWVFENINVAIPAPELNAAREDGATHADFQILSPDGQVLAREAVRLPAEFAAAPPARAAPLARAPEAHTRREEPEPTETPEVASARDLPERREPPPDERRDAPPPTRRPPARTEAAAPPSSASRENTARNSEANGRKSEPSGRKSDTAGRKSDTVVRESKPTTPPRTEEKPAPGASAQRDEKSRQAERRPTRETEIEPLTPAKKEPPTAREEAESPSDSAASTETVYTVKASDSLRSISLEHYGDAQYWPLILRANPDVNPLKLKAGDRLVLPALDSAGSARTPSRSTEKGSPERKDVPVYVTKEGDTLPFIAKQLYGDSRRWREIYDLNRDQLETPSALRAGQRLKLPAPANASENARPPARP